MKLLLESRDGVECRTPQTRLAFLSIDDAGGCCGFAIAQRTSVFSAGGAFRSALSRTKTYAWLNCPNRLCNRARRKASIGCTDFLSQSSLNAVSLAANTATRGIDPRPTR